MTIKEISPYEVEKEINKQYQKYFVNIREKYLEEFKKIWYIRTDMIWDISVVMEAVEKVLDLYFNQNKKHQ